MTKQQEKGSPRTSGIQVIARAGSIMRVLGVNPQGLSLAAIAHEVGLPRSTVQRITQALAEEMLVEHIPGGGIRLGPALGQLISQTQTDITSMTRPYIQELGEQLQESVSLCSQAGDRVYVIDRLVAERELRIVFPVGVYAPLYATAAGKVLLSKMTASDIEHVLPATLPALTPATLSREQLLEQLKQVREQEIASDCNEIIEGIGSYAVALDTYMGLYALSVIVPTARQESGRERICEALLKCKRDIERVIG